MTAVRVEGMEIPERLIAEEAQNHPGASLQEARVSAVRALAVKALLLRRAEELGLCPDPEADAAGREETDEEALIRAVLDAEVEIDEPTEAECHRVFEARPDAWRGVDLFEASHILFEPTGQEADAWARAEAEAVATLKRIEAGEIAFEQAARALSACTSGQNGGSLGQLSRGDLVGPVEEALLALAVGGMTAAPARSRFGWHLLRLDRRIEAGALPFEAVRERIAVALAGRAWSAAAARYVEGLSARYDVEGVRLSLRPRASDRVGTLGELTAELEALEQGVARWLAARDAILAEQISGAATKSGVDPADYVRAAVEAFAAEADDEAWTKLISAAQDAADPAFACITVMLNRKLSAERRTFTIIKRV